MLSPFAKQYCSGKSILSYTFNKKKFLTQFRTIPQSPGLWRSFPRSVDRHTISTKVSFTSESCLAFSKSLVRSSPLTVTPSHDQPPRLPRKYRDGAWHWNTKRSWLAQTKMNIFNFVLPNSWLSGYRVELVASGSRTHSSCIFQFKQMQKRQDKLTVYFKNLGAFCLERIRYKQCS